MSVRNDEKNITACIESILPDLYENDEFVIIDDASDDNSFNLLKSFAERDQRIIIFRNENCIGLAASLNIAVQNAQHDLICRMDSDDINIIGRISSLRKEFDDEGLSFAGTKAYKFISNKNKKNKMNVYSDFLSIKSQLFFDSAMIHPTVMFRKKVFTSIDMYDRTFLLCQDYDLWCRAIISGHRLSNLSIYGLNYRVTSSNNKEKIIKRYVYSSKIRRDYFKFFSPNVSNKALDLHCFICGDESYRIEMSKLLIDEYLNHIKSLCHSINVKVFKVNLLRKLAKKIHINPLLVSYFLFRVLFIR